MGNAVRYVALLVVVLASIGCAADDADTELVETEQEAICNTCDPPPPPLPACSSTCSTSAVCSKECQSGGLETTCGNYGVCKSCSSACSASTPCATQCRNSGALTTCGSYGVCGVQTTYCAYPRVTRSRVVKNHENWPNGGWQFGYLYIVESGAEKVGNLPVSLGFAPTVTFETNVWASNFQGAYKQSNTRAQFETRYVSESPPDYYWTPNGLVTESNHWPVVDSCRTYPLVDARRCATVYGPSPALAAVTLHVKEHDDATGGTNDEVGKFTVALDACRTQVFNTGLASGWTSTMTVPGEKYDADADDNDTIDFVSYQLWCYRCVGSTCGFGVGATAHGSLPALGGDLGPSSAGEGGCP